MKVWNFDKWFEAQHGPRPTEMDLGQLQKEVGQLKAYLRMRTGLLDALLTWEARRTSALYAWQIKDAEKKG